MCCILETVSNTQSSRAQRESGREAGRHQPLRSLLSHAIHWKKTWVDGGLWFVSLKGQADMDGESKLEGDVLVRRKIKRLLQ